jgi:endogenous inhibitor of DNA gyrase (YacG/DUF329 family)
MFKNKLMVVQMPPREISCPNCQRPTVWVDNDNRPFCSERCRLIDLGAWIEESYRIPAGTSLSAAEHEDNIV